MAVNLRKKPSTDGKKQTLFLDYQLNGKRFKEYLKLYLFTRPKDAIEKKHNDDTKKLADSIRSKKELIFNEGGVEVQMPFKRDEYFLSYFERFIENYKKNDKRMFHACLHHFKNFLTADNIKHLTFKTLSEQLCFDFYEYLKSDAVGLSGETPADYMQRLKKLLKQAVREKYFSKSPADDVRLSRKSDNVKKEILSTDEIQTLAKTPCGNAEVKRAFLFACFTGLRFCDVEALTWQHIKDTELTINQQKTGEPVTVPLKPTSKKLLGERAAVATEKVFELPSHNATLKNLRNWAAKGGIDKHITFHCARHSFGTNLVINGGNIKAVSSALGHSDFKHTQKYIRTVKDMVQDAVLALPEIEL